MLFLIELILNFKVDEVMLIQVEKYMSAQTQHSSKTRPVRIEASVPHPLSALSALSLRCLFNEAYIQGT